MSTIDSSSLIDGNNSIFGPGPNYDLNACVGRNGGPATFERISTGFFEAGRRLVQSLQEDSTSVDSLIYPVVLVYRHAIETALKHLAEEMPELFDEMPATKRTHKLMDNWCIVRRDLTRLKVSAADLDDIERILQDFVAVDPTSEVFRYPYSKSGSLSLDEVFLIDVEVFGSKMEILSEFFNSCAFGVDAMRFQKEEYESSLQDLYPS